MFNLKLIIMSKNEKKEELQSRREFIKKTAKGALPILGISLFGPSILTSCDKDEPESGNNEFSGCGKSCSGSCDGSCSGSCESCTGSCDGSSCKYM